MTLDEIIRKDEDRVFTVDPECFIIFTGESLDDTRPFIRIGNWIDLPAGIIPLIENIIVTDTMAGNPAHEQFNIDIKYLPVNRYIGSHSIVRRFLDYQKIFGLDLHNASVVDAERDIPEISTSSAVSDRESFIGIFYKDGNFKIVHNKKKIFDLSESFGSPMNSQAVHENLAKTVKNPKRYAGAGVLFIDGNPLYYKGSAFASYLLPSRYYARFCGLGINPRAVSAVMHPSQNFLPLARFLKWKHNAPSKLTIFSDSKEEIALQKALFAKAKIDLHPFTGMKADVLKGLSIEQKHHSFNIAAAHDTAHGTVRTAFIKGPTALAQTAKEKFDCIFVSYSVFEDCVSTLRSSVSPVVVIDDGNPSVAKVPRPDYTVLRQDVQYEFVVSRDEQETLHRISQLLPSDIADGIAGKDYDAIGRIRDALVSGKGGYEPETAVNAAALASYLLHITPDRKFSALLKEFVRTLFASENYVLAHREPGLYRFDLIFTGKGVFETAQKIHADGADLFCPDELREEDAGKAPAEYRPLCRKIMRDRERLNDLLSLYHTNPDAAKNLESLSNEIQKRKEAFRSEMQSHPEKGREFIAALRNSVEKVQRKEQGGPQPLAMLKQLLKKETISEAIGETASDKGSGKKGKPRRRKGGSSRQYFIVAGIAVAFLLSALGIVMLFHSNAVQKKLEHEQQLVQNAATARERLKEKYHITVSDYDIYLFANKTAIKNGYAPIPVKDFNKKNPHWIYPGNTFVLADGEEIRIKDGDTLWKISRARIEKLYIDFYVVIDAIQRDIKQGKKPDPAAVRTAQSLARTEEQKKLAAGFDGNQ